MKLSVVIVNYNVKYFLEQCLLSVRRACSDLQAEVFVVDNNSVDGSVEMVRQKFPEVILLANTENYGFSKANNQAIAQAKGDYVLLLNPDTVVQEDTFIKTIGFMDEHAEAGGLGVRMIDGSGRFLPESKRGLPSPRVAFYKMSGLARLFPKSPTFGSYHLGYLNEMETHAVDVLSGAFMLIRRSVLEQIGYLDETFFMYGEDIDLSYRITKAGYINYYFPGTSIIHYKGESTKKSSVNYVFVFYNAMVIFAKKHYSASQAGWFSLLIRFAIWVRALVALLYRGWLGIRQPLLDAGLVYAGIYGLKLYWEQNIKYVSGGKYPPEYMLVNAVIYTVCWIGGIYFSGGYSRRASLGRLIRGILLGTLAISVTYAFLDESYRFSRALIVLGALASGVVLCGYRLLYRFIRFGEFRWGSGPVRNTIIIGDPPESERVLAMLNNAKANFKFVGFVSPTQRELKDDNYLGSLSQLNDMLDMFRVDELIFCSKDLPATRIIQLMTQLGQSGVAYKIVPEESAFIIGSHDKNSSGDLYALELALSITKPERVRIKKTFDVVVSILLILGAPVVAWFIPHHKQFFRNVWQTLTGKKSLVGYAPSANAGTLPYIKQGVLNPLDKLPNMPEYGKAAGILNVHYARDYSLMQDVVILIKGFRKLGRAC